MKWLSSTLRALVICAATCSMQPRDALSQQVSVDRVELVAFGIYKIDTAAQQVLSSSATGKINVAPTAALFMQTGVVPGKLGVKFGFEYIVHGQPAGSAAKLTVVIMHPPIRRPDATSLETTTRFDTSPRIGERAYTGWSFDDAWTIVPGKWTWTLLVDGRPVLEQSFVVK